MTGDTTSVLPEIDYLSKDYASFRQVILDHLTTRIPAWKEVSEADIGNVIVEVLAYAADYLSYYQDAVATEAYLGTARRRSSIKHHVRLLDYILHEGCNTRTWAYLAVSQDTTLPRGTPLLTRIGELADVPVIAPGSFAYTDASAQELAAFETMYASSLLAAHNELNFFVEAKQESILPAGSLSATLHDPGVDLKVGQVLLFEEVKGETTGDPLDADPTHRCVVRLNRIARGNRKGTPVVTIEWSLEDALPFALTLATHCDGEYVDGICVARGNMILADYGRTVYYEPLPPVGDDPRYRPRLLFSDLTHCVSYEQESLPASLSASQALIQDPLDAMPAITLFKRDDIGSIAIDAAMALSLDNDTLSDALRQTLYTGKGIALSDTIEVRAIYGLGWLLQDPPSKQCILLTRTENNQPLVSVLKQWALRRDLISSVPLTNTFCVDMEADGQAYLRFCSSDLGEPPDPGTLFVANYRVGRGTAGNLSADVLAHAVVADERIIAVRNPLAVQGGVKPQSIEEARQQAPFEFQSQQRCVTEADYAEIACRHPQVVNALAQFRWTGSWYTTFVYVQRSPGLAVDGRFKSVLARYLEDFRLAGHEIAICAPYYVPLHIALRVRLKPNYYTNIVHVALLQAFSNETTGFFYPGNFTFGQTVYLSQIIAAAMSVKGVAEVEVERFKRLDTREAQVATAEQIVIHPLEIIRLDNDVHAPQNGSMFFRIEGGL
jgi:hypothetical protein